MSPLAAFIGLKLGGIYSPGSVYLGFVIIPLVELYLSPSAYNPTKEEELQLQRKRFFDILLETVNYIEHYGLVRKQLPDVTYERQSAAHSWNSDHVLGRIYLYELTRHADHHMRPTKKYQTLQSIEASPQLPVGYPASMLISLVPPLWFRMIDKYLMQDLDIM